MITVVLAGSRPQFIDWCRENDVHPEDRNVVWATESHHLRGLGRPVQVVVYGTFWDRRGAYELHADATDVARRNECIKDPDPPRPWSWRITGS